MSNKQEIRNFYGKILGYINEERYTGNQIATDFYGRQLGKWDKKENVTRDFYGRILAKGNILSSLIYNNESEGKNK